MNDVNIEAITSMQSCYKIWLVDGCNHISVKPNLLTEQKGVHESFSSRRTSQKSLNLTIPWNLAKLVKNYHGIIVHQRLIDLRRMVFAERAVHRIKEGTSAVQLQSGFDEKWWADSVECSCSLRNVQDLLADGKTPYERRFGEPFEGPVIPFGAMVEYHPISARDRSRLHPFGKKVLPGIFRIGNNRGEHLER